MEQDSFIHSQSDVKTSKNLIVKDKVVIGDNETSIQHGQRFRRVGVRGSNYSVAADDYLLGVDDLVLAPTIGLLSPRVGGIGKLYIVKDEAGGAASTTITVVSAGEETIDGASSSTLTTNYQAKRFYSDGSNWFTC